MKEKHYFCIVFFMVLDLRLMEKACRDDKLFFLRHLHIIALAH